MLLLFHLKGIFEVKNWKLSHSGRVNTTTMRMMAEMNSYFIDKHTPDISMNNSHVINSPRTTLVTDEKMWHIVVNEHIQGHI